jgi:hypothetical protein
MQAPAIAVIAASLLLPLVAHAQDAQPPDRSVESIAVSEPNRIVCAFLYHEGGVIRRPVCHSARFWANEHTRTRREILDYQLRRLEIGR